MSNPNLNPKQFRTGGLIGNMWGEKGTVYSRGDDAKWTRHQEDGSKTTFDKTVFVHSDFIHGLKLHNGVPHYLPKNSDTHVPVPSEGISSEPKAGTTQESWHPISYNIEINPANKAQWRPKDIWYGTGISSVD